MALNPYAQPFSPAPTNPENNVFTAPPMNPENNVYRFEQNRQRSRQLFESAAYAANPEIQADENLEAFLAWSESQRTKNKKTRSRSRKAKRNQRKSTRKSKTSRSRSSRRSSRK